MLRSVLFAAALFGSACTGTTTPEAPPTPEPPPADKVEEAPAPDASLTAIFKPLPADMSTPERPLAEARVTLGRMLYYDPRLSKNHDISCNTCHKLDTFGVDNEPTSPGHKGQRGDRNSPTVYNAALHIAQFWDGRAADVEEQAIGPILNPVEMAMNDEAHVLKTLRSIPGYQPLFAAAFPGDEDPITYSNVGIAIGAFERGLVTPGKWDAYLKGDGSALTAAEVEGAQLFVQTGCITCHMGENLGGAMYQKLGLVHPYETEDEGRKAATGKDADLLFFKVPSLRNVAKTGPYFHDGSVETLPQAVKLMAWHQLGKELTDEEIGKIVVFLEALTGEPDQAYISKPELPENGPDTPAPDPT